MSNEDREPWSPMQDAPFTFGGATEPAPSALGSVGPGAFDLRVFDQAELWFDRDAVPYRVAAMSGRERRALRRWLLANADFFYVQVLRRELATALHLEEVEVPPGLDGSAALALPPMLYLSSQGWLARTPLYAGLDGRTTG